jgi:hypothetical protein
LDGGSGVNIITKQPKTRLGLRKPKLTPYNLQMGNQITTKPIGLIRDLNMYVHGIPYITTFTNIYNIIVDFSYSMLLGRPWFKDTKVAHDRGNNMIII